MSGLTKKIVIADHALSTILGVKEGEMVSYAELSKGLHKYIKDNDLKNPQRAHPATPTLVPKPEATEPTPLASSSAVPSAISAEIKKCRDCGAEIPVEATFCDLCGVRQ
jgi:ribosomal protein L40E